MPRLGKRSMANLASCDERLQMLAVIAGQEIDITVIEGHRSHTRQALLRARGDSQLMHGYHNVFPSLAFDWIPAGVAEPFAPENAPLFYACAGYMRAVARELSIPIVQGYDWDMDWNIREHSFQDVGHVQLAVTLPPKTLIKA